jgi:hypothetical protein
LLWLLRSLHNPLKEPERYLLYGAISARMAEEMRKPEVRSRPRLPLPLDAAPAQVFLTSDAYMSQQMAGSGEPPS